MHLTDVSHMLETRERRGGHWTLWHPTLDKNLAPARLLASDGRALEAVALAFDITANTEGHCHDVDFRVVTRSTTVTVMGGELSDERRRA